MYRRYKDHEPGQLATAAALLGHLLTGGKRDDAQFIAGIAAISDMGPSKSDPRLNYFGTQVMFHAQGEAWTRWNEELRESLVKTQGNDGVAKGSWFFPDGDGAESGGRLYHTAVTTLTLEVYYRHLPVFRDP